MGFDLLNQHIYGIDRAKASIMLYRCERESLQAR